MLSWISAHNVLILSQRIDTKTESVELANTSQTEANGLGSAISDSEPRYSIFKYSHSFDGEGSPLVFIYSFPAGLGVRDRMLYASSKIGFLTALQKDLGLKISKKAGHLPTDSFIHTANARYSLKSRVRPKLVSQRYRMSLNPNKRQSKPLRGQRNQVDGSRY